MRWGVPGAPSAERSWLCGWVDLGRACAEGAGVRLLFALGVENGDWWSLEVTGASSAAWEVPALPLEWR